VIKNLPLPLKTTNGFFLFPSEVAHNITVTQAFSCPVVANETVFSPFLVIVLVLAQWDFFSL